jgi:hypothetical protein
MGVEAALFFTRRDKLSKGVSVDIGQMFWIEFFVLCGGSDRMFVTGN